MSGVVTAYVAVAVVGAAIAYEGNRKAGSMAEDAARQQAKAAEVQAQQAQARAVQEAELERERIAYESTLAAENAAYEIEIAAKNADVAADQKTKEYNRVKAAQLAGAAAAGLIDLGSTRTVMERSTEAYETDIGEVRRALDIFSETRTKEAAEVAKGGEFGLSQFLARSTRETTFEVENRSMEAAAYRSKGSAAVSQARMANYGVLVGTIGSGIRGYAMSKMAPKQRYGSLALGS